MKTPTYAFILKLLNNRHILIASLMPCTRESYTGVRKRPFRNRERLGRAFRAMQTIIASQDVGIVLVDRAGGLADGLQPW